jgi:hypothetical protein
MKVISKYEVEFTIKEDVTQEHLSNLKEVYEGNTTKMLELRRGLEYELGKKFGGVAKVKSQVIISNLGELQWVKN